MGGGVCLIEALTQYEETVLAVGMTMDDNTKEQASALLLKAKITRASAKLLETFAQHTTISDLRPLVQKEVKALRNRGLQEGSALHPMLVQKIRSTLAMRA
eukprot:6478489-Amphidinium_carterae.2